MTNVKKVKQIIKQNEFTEFLLYTTPNKKVKVEIFLHNENIWLTQARIAELFGVNRPAITKHLKNIFETGELNKKSVSSILEHTAKDGKKYKTLFYNLDAIISVGYRINSSQATQFRIWATERLKEYIIKGFTMNDEKLKDPYNIFGKDYFEEQLARIRDIRSSERRFYQKITDIYALCSIDYDPNEEITRQFFATVQNKLHFAISGQTAAEIIYNRVGGGKPNMGLNTWRNSPKGAIRKTDVVIAKNYLNEKELDGLNRIVTMYLDYAEMQAQKGIAMRMKDWVDKLDAFLQFNEKDILQDSGKISHEVVEELALKEYEKYKKIQDKNYISDFDLEIKKLLKKVKNRGFSTIETLLASSILVLIVTAFMGAFIYGSESTALAGQRARATFLAEEGLEASRNIRDAGFSNLTDGTKGLAISGNQWTFSGSSDLTDSFYTRQITISTIDSSRKQVTSAVTWQQNPQRTGSVSLVTYLTNWKASAAPPATCNDYAVLQGYSSGTCRQNTQQCTNNSETYLSGGDSNCVTSFPGDPSRDTCCALP